MKSSPRSCIVNTEIVRTIGHSNRPIEEFIDLLTQNGVECLLDIRTVPKSRHNPQFGRRVRPERHQGSRSGGRSGRCSGRLFLALRQRVHIRHQDALTNLPAR
jgi:hypothetical protein